MVRTTIPWAVLLVDGVRAGNGALGPGHRPGLFIVSLVNVYAARAGRHGRPWTYAGRAERLLRRRSIPAQSTPPHLFLGSRCLTRGFLRFQCRVLFYQVLRRLCRSAGHVLDHGLAKRRAADLLRTLHEAREILGQG